MEFEVLRLNIFPMHFLLGRYSFTSQNVFVGMSSTICHFLVE